MNYTLMASPEKITDGPSGRNYTMRLRESQITSDVSITHTGV